MAVDLPVDGQQLRVQALHVADVGAPREKSESGLYIEIELKGTFFAQSVHIKLASPQTECLSIFF